MNKDTIESLLEITGVTMAIVLMVCILPVACIICCFGSLKKELIKDYSK